MLSKIGFAVFLIAFLLCQESVGQDPALEKGSLGAARAIAEFQRQAPTVVNATVGLRQIEDGQLKPGAEGIVYYGEGVVVRDEANSSTFPVLQIIDDNNLLLAAQGNRVLIAVSSHVFRRKQQIMTLNSCKLARFWLEILWESTLDCLGSTP